MNEHYCKLTDENGQTHGGMQWGEGITHTASGEGDLCRPGWIEVAGRSKTDNGLKVGFTQVTTIREISLSQGR